uniref:Secreted protein n=1 Tax=Strongyloides papillosus TaxID=174720 RepID=A0A0N5CIC8_STREA
MFTSLFLVTIAIMSDWCQLNRSGNSKRGGVGWTLFKKVFEALIVFFMLPLLSFLKKKFSQHFNNEENAPQTSLEHALGVN